MEFIVIQMDQAMKGIGQMILNMELEPKYGKMVHFLMDNIYKAKKKELVQKKYIKLKNVFQANINGQTDQFMKENGVKVIYTDLYLT